MRVIITGRSVTIAAALAATVVAAALAAMPASASAASRVTGRPAIASISPSRAATAGHTPITVTGTGFTKVRKVSFGTEKATAYRVLDSKHLMVWTPLHSAGTAHLTVRTAAGTTSQHNSAFHFVAAPKPAAWRTKATPMPAGFRTVDSDAKDDVSTSHFATACASASLCYQTGLFRTTATEADFESVLVTQSETSPSSQPTPSSPAGLDTHLPAIACADAHWCLGVGEEAPVAPGSNGLTVTLVDGSATASSVAPESGHQYLGFTHVSCPAEGVCDATGYEVNASGGFTWIVAQLRSGTWTIRHIGFQATSVDCGGVGFCVAVGDKRSATLADGSWTQHALPKPSGVGSEWTAALVDCSAPEECTVAGSATQRTGDENAKVSVWTLHKGRWTVHQVGLPGRPRANDISVTGLSCPAARQCSIVGNGPTGFVVRQDGGALAAQGVPVPSGFGKKLPSTTLSSVSCTSSTYCAAVGTVGNYGLATIWRDGVWTSVRVGDGSLASGTAPLTFDSVQCTSPDHCLTSGLLHTHSGKAKGWNRIQEIYARS